MSERQQMWNRAVAAQNSGNDDLAEMLFKAIGRIGKDAPKQIPSTGLFAMPTRADSGEVTYIGTKPIVTTAAPAAEPQAASEDPDKFFLTEGDLVYAIGTVTNHNSVGFAPFLDENIRKLRSPLPLTIFNRKWQQRAMAYHLDRRQRSDDSSANKDKSGGYKGFSFVQEWTQTYAQWTRNHRAFAKTLHDVYKIIKFSKLLATHKNNCDNTTEEFGFMVGFRYNMMEVRSNTFSHHITDEEVKNAIPDISQRKESVVEQCYNTCRNFGELEWEENLYAPGLSHSNHDPLTGYLKPTRNMNFQSSHHSNAMISNPHMNGQGWMSHTGNGYINGAGHGGQAYNGRFSHPGGNQSGGNGYQGFQNGAKRPRGGYKGNNHSNNPTGPNDGGQVNGKRNNHNK
ncbi:hypothetical protein PGTUg99_027562 [Puccinia graminis f. sp. tritici]|uniref:Uncharacterized protein n=1 Tax=Puccinia graminis f. sp. tritici TaxID=56615 RepID=A0A5B0REN8_PUCGR|nr:hypothetical protein PGTUg99_027562 [Puccinia graminis f. sp. tritici]